MIGIFFFRMCLRPADEVQLVAEFPDKVQLVVLLVVAARALEIPFRGLNNRIQRRRSQNIFGIFSPPAHPPSRKQEVAIATATRGLF